MATPVTGIPHPIEALETAERLIIHQQASPNSGPRRSGLRPRYVVIHHTAMISAEAAIARLCDPIHEVSAHYVICKTGQITQLVSEGRRAWHAGAGEWSGHSDMNSRSIGIELDNDGQGPFSEPLMNSLEGLLAGMLAAWDIPPHKVIGHSDMAPGRKSDPGPWFDWARLEAKALARPRGQALVPAATADTFKTMAQRVGYTADVPDRDLLDAVRLRYRPFAQGPLTQHDLTPLTQNPQGL